MENFSPAALDDITKSDGLLGASEADGKFEVPKLRMPKATAASALWKKMKSDDGPLSLKRAQVMAMRDGTPPYSPDALKRARLGSMVNLNFGSGDLYLSQAETAFYDLISSVDRMVVLKTKLGDPQQRHEWSEIISEEVSRGIRDWESFVIEYLTLVQAFVMHGVGIAYHEDPWQWTWRSTHLGEIKVPRQARVSESALEVCAALRPIQVHELYQCIENEQQAAERGWDVAAVKKALVQANKRTTGTFGDDEWEKLQSEIRNGDLAVSASSEEVRLVHMWVKEFSGKVSHLLFVEDRPELGYLYQKADAYDQMGQVVTLFALGIGTNGTIHSVRGLGSKIFPAVQYQNRLLSAMTGSAFLSSSLLLQPADETALKNLSLTYSGAYSVMSPGTEAVERAYPDMTRAMLPALDQMNEMIRERAGQFTAHSVFGGDSRRTRFEVAAEVESAGQISQVSQAFFYEAWGRLMKESVKRMLRRDYPAGVKGYAERKRIIERCMERGVPREAIFELDFDSIIVVQAVGGGSAVRRLAIYEKMWQVAGAADPVGRQNIFRDYMRELAGGSLVDRYSTPAEAPREPIEAQIARLENVALEAGEAIEVGTNGMDTTHLDQHLARLEMRAEQLKNGEIDLAEAAIKGVPVYEHCVKHLDNMQDDTSTGNLQASYRARLKVHGELINNGIKHLQKLQKEQADAQQQEGQQPAAEQGEATGMAAKITESQLKLDFLKKKQELQLDFELRRAAMKRSMQEAEAASRIFDALK